MPLLPDVQTRLSRPKTKEQLQEILKAIQNFLTANYFEREDAIKQLIMAVLTKQHVLLFGAPGTSKSRIVESFMSCFEGINTFTKQLSRQTPEEALIGTLNPKKLREQGIYDYNTTGTMVDAHLAYLDEIFDANDSTLRSTLEILNERVFRKGHIAKKCPLVSCFMASNFHREDKNIEAFIDRILFRSNILPIFDRQNKLSMVRNFVTNCEAPVYEGTKLTLADIQELHRLVSEIVVPPDFLNYYVQFVNEFSAGSRVVVSDRKLNNVTHVLKAAAFLSGDTTVTFEHFISLRYSLYIVGHAENDSKVFDTLLAKYSKLVVAMPSNLGAVKTKIEKAVNDTNLKGTDEQLEKTLKEFEALFKTLEDTDRAIRRSGIDGIELEKAKTTVKELETLLDKGVAAVLQETENRLKS